VRSDKFRNTFNDNECKLSRLETVVPYTNANRASQAGIQPIKRARRGDLNPI
jgi:hypothetical protein